MTLIGRNIRKIRAVKKISQSAFAELFSLSRPAVGAYEEGRAEPKIETILEIANYFSISVEKLLTKELTINEIYQFDIFNPELNKAISGAELEIGLVESLMLDDYLANGTEATYRDKLQKMKFPPAVLKAEIAFEIPHDSLYNSTGLKPGEIIFCNRVKKEKIKDAALMQSLFFVVYPKGFALGHFTTKEKKIVFAQAGPGMDALELPTRQVQEIWKIIAVLNRHVEFQAALETRLGDLEKKIDLLNKKIKKPRV